MRLINFLFIILFISCEKTTTSENGGLLFINHELLADKDFTFLFGDQGEFYLKAHIQNDSCPKCIFSNEFLFEIGGTMDYDKRNILYSYKDKIMYDEPLICFSEFLNRDSVEFELYSGKSFIKYLVNSVNVDNQYYLQGFNHVNQQIGECDQKWDTFNVVIDKKIKKIIGCFFSARSICEAKTFEREIIYTSLGTIPDPVRKLLERELDFGQEGGWTFQ